MCQYCGCDSNSVIGRLMKEHVSLVNLAGALRDAVHDHDVDAIRHHGGHLATELMGHAGFEEAGIFAELEGRDEFAPTIVRLKGEHRQLDELLEGVLDEEDGAWEEFSALMRKHFDEEENGLFPAAYVELLADDWASVADSEHAMQHAMGLAHSHAGPEGDLAEAGEH